MNLVSRWIYGAAGLLLMCSVQVQSAERSSAHEAREMLENAVAMLEEKGPGSAFAAFNDRNGRFYDNDLYIFAVDMTGKYYASGANPKLVGSDLSGLTDAAGRPVGKMILDLANKMGQGLIEYEWLNRATNDIELKITRIRRVGDYVLGVGFYLPRPS